MQNSEKIILDLCGGTGMWSKPYKDAGYTVYNITHPKHDVFDIFYAMGRVKIGDIDISVESVYGILAAPTCTHFSLARTTAKTPRDLAGAYRLIQACLDLTHYCRIEGNLKFWALENPVGYLRQLLGKPPLTFNPMDYGANYSKKTDLWGYYNFPKKKPNKLTEDEAARCSINNRVLPKLPSDYILPDNFRPQQARRSMTDEHFALAFFKANRV